MLTSHRAKKISPLCETLDVTPMTKAHTSLTSVSKKQFSGFGLWGRGEGGGLKLQHFHFGVSLILMQELALVWMQKMKERLSSCVDFFGTPWSGSREDSLLYENKATCAGRPRPLPLPPNLSSLFPISSQSFHVFRSFQKKEEDESDEESD